MACTVNPAVSGASYRRWLLHVATFAVGVASGAMLTYALVAGAYMLVASSGARGAWLFVLVPLLLVGVLRDLFGRRVRVPYRDNSQVPEWVRDMLPPGGTAFV